MWNDFKMGELEAILFAAGEPLSVPQLAAVMSIPRPRVWELLHELENSLSAESRGITLRQIGSGYQLCTKEQYHEAVKQLQETREIKLTNAAMETLALVAFRQPITRSEMEAVRGVKVDGVVNTLVDYGLIAEAGRKDVLGHPLLYATTAKFLETFGLRSLDDLPQLADEAFRDVPEEVVQPLLNFENEEETSAASSRLKIQDDADRKNLR